MSSELELYFQYKCEKGLEKRGLNNKIEYKERLKYEITVIKQTGFSAYFLIVADLINWAVRARIPTGPGRGSAGGSLVAYVLEITQLDPIKYKLIFERFLNPDRISPPDIDLDFCEARRHEIVQYIISKYGKDKVAHIGTYGSMKAKASIRDVARCRGFEYDLGDKLARLTLAPIEGKPQSLAVCYEQVPELRNMRQRDGTAEQEILFWADQVEDRIKSFSTHASGIVISDRPIYELIPLYPGKDGLPTTQFEMKTVEEIGLIKFDLLGLRALTTINRCLNLIKENTNEDIDILNISLDSKEIYSELQKGSSTGVFQLEGSSGIRDLLVQVKPTCLEDIATICAAFRPGPLGSKEFAHYLKVRLGETTPNYLVPELEPILKVTDGLLIYQEQVLEICKQLAGYTLGEADLMRRAIGKKISSEMAAQQSKFINGMVKNKFSKSIAIDLFNEIKSFAAYGFNLSHAICYALISYQMAWLKTFYPLEFMCACMISDADESDKIIRYIAEAKRLGITVQPPSINESGYTFTLNKQNNTIRFGLSAIKNLGKPVQLIINERNLNGQFTDIINFTNRVDTGKLNRRKLESLVMSGAIDHMPNTQDINRASLLAAIDSIWNYREESKRYQSKLETYNKKVLQWETRETERATLLAEGVKKIPNTLKKSNKPIEPISPIITNLKEDMDMLEILQNEKELLGFYVSGHPLDLVTEWSRSSISSIKDSSDLIYKTEIIAIPSIIKEITTKQSKKKMAYITLEDKTGTIEAVIFPKTFAKFADYIDTKIPAKYRVSVKTTETDSLEGIKELSIESIESLPSIKYRTKELVNHLDIDIQSMKKMNKLTELLLEKLVDVEKKKTSLAITLSIPELDHIWEFTEININEEKDVLSKKIKGL